MRSTVIALAVFDKPPDWPRMRARFDRLTRMVPALRMRPLQGVLGIAPPRLALDPDFDLDVHLRRYRLPESASWSEVLADVRRMSLTDFDRHRPLWEVVQIEGLPNGQAAVAMKLHHSIADGEATVKMALALFEFGSEAQPDNEEIPEVPRGEDVSSVDVARANVEDLLRMMRDGVERAIEVGGKVFREAIDDPAAALDSVRETLDSVSRAVAVPPSSLSPLWRERGTTYHFGTFHVPFTLIKNAAKARGFSVNDVFVAAALRGAASYHSRFGAQAHELRINVPISLRGDAGDRSAQSSNAVAIARFEMPVHGLPVEQLMQEAHDQVDRWRSAPAARMSDPLADISWFVPVPVIAHAASASDVTTSNVPGPPISVYLAGSRMTHVFPLVATIGAAVNITMVTYDGTACIGVSSDDRCVPDISNLLGDLTEAFADVLGCPVGDIQTFEMQ